MIGCTCAVCRSADPRDRRTRPSIYLQVENGPAILIDTSTDLRLQALAHGVTRVDAILFTHSHADHIMGIDEVRRFNAMQGGPIPAYADERTAGDLRRSFAYVFDPPKEKGGGIPQIGLSTIASRFNVDSVGVEPVPIFHGARPILGFRFGSFAYLTDCNRLADEAWGILDGVDTLILDALRHRPHPTHFTVAEALEVVARLRPRQTYLTHICHDLPHAATNQSLHSGVELAYDGLSFSIEAASAFAEASTSAEASADKTADKPSAAKAPEDKWT
jgi:phosphoribosyl 1,2-cyclic phosphate phosphodiesterase